MRIQKQMLKYTTFEGRTWHEPKVGLLQVLILNRYLYEWWGIRCELNNGHQKDIISLQEIELHAQNLVTIMLGSIVNIIRVTYKFVQ